MEMLRLVARRLFSSLVLVLLLAPLAARAETMTWNIRTFDKHAVDVSFYSQNRKAVWPGNGRVFTIKDYKVHSFKLNCIAGEKICYGAWVRGASRDYWGKGKGGRHICTDCCYTCEDGLKTPIINLNE